MNDARSRQFTVEDLPRFSPWPARLLGLEAWQPRIKTPAEIRREFDCDKWGTLLERYRNTVGPVTVDAAEAWTQTGAGDVLCSIGERFEVLELPEALCRHREIIAGALHERLPASALVELGAGFGAVILRLAGDSRFRGVQLCAAEYTDSGVELMRQLANEAGIELQVGHCDLGSDALTSLCVPAGAAIFTSMAAHYLPELKDGFVHALRRLQPRVVIHFEPCYEHCDLNTMTGVMRRRYIELNDYNRNLASLLHRHAASGAIRILQELPGVIGVNPLLPISVIVWAPVV